MSEHAKYSPSKLPRIVRCPGSVQETLNMVQRPSSYASEGTMLHSVVEACLNLNELKLPATITAEYRLDKSQEEAVQECLDYILGLRMSVPEDAYDVSESKITLAEFAGVFNCPDLDDVYGTLDYSMVIPSQRTIHVTDWKFGKGVEVFPDTEQLKAYALGRLKNSSHASQFDTVVCTIVQPRLYTDELIKTETYSVKDLFNWLEDTLVPALLEAKSSNPRLYVNEKACMFCEAKRTCSMRKAQNLQAAMDVFAVHATLPDEVDMDHLVKVLTFAKDLEKYLNDIKDHAFHLLRTGKEVPGYKLVEGKSNRCWQNEEAAKVYLISTGLTDADLYEKKFVSPAKVEKKLGKKNTCTPEFLAQVFKPKGSPTLVPASDRRAPMVFQTAEEAFASFV